MVLENRCRERLAATVNSRIGKRIIERKAQHALPQIASRIAVRRSRTQWTMDLGLRGGLFAGFHRPGRLHAEVSDYQRSCGAHDYYFFREPGVHHRREQHHTDLGRFWSDERHHHAGRVRINVCERFGCSEPDCDHHLHADGDEHHGIGNGNGDRDCDSAEPAHDQLVHCEPDEHYAGWHQRAQLDNIGSDDAEHCAGKSCVDFGKRHGERKPGDNDHICFDGDQCGGIGDGVG